jgi:hypothetical protein
MLIKETIKFNSQDKVMLINLGGNNKILGLQQEIDNLVEKTKINLINPITDNEVYRFKYNPPFESTYIEFYFTSDNSTYSNSFTKTIWDVLLGRPTGGANFTTHEIQNGTVNVKNSFYIVDLYDSYDSYTQNKISSNYNTNILNSVLVNNTSIPKYFISFNSINPFYYITIPKKFIDGQTDNIVNVYCKYSFYNSKTGVVNLFYNKTIENFTTPEKMYFKIEINISDMTWKYNFFNYNDLTTPITIKPYQVLSNNAYHKKINNGVENITNLKPVFPSGNTFQSNDGNYDNGSTNINV